MIDNIEDFFKFVNERQNVFMRRFNDGRGHPWTKDNAIANYHYTNVYRELDRGTVFYIKYIAHNKAPPFGPWHDFKIFSTIMYRIFNKIETYSAITQDLIYEEKGWDKEIVTKTLQKIDDACMPIFTNAFMVTGSVYPGMTKSDQMVKALDEIWQQRDDIIDMCKFSSTLEDVWMQLQAYPGIGPFLAYEIVCDLMYAKILPFTEDDWVNVGPGAKKGLWEIWPQLDESEMVKEISFLRNSQRDYLDTLGFRYLNNWDIDHFDSRQKELTLRNIEHSLCEYSKYKRAQRGERMKRKWHGVTPDDGWYRHALYDLYGVGKPYNIATPLLAGEIN